MAEKFYRLCALAFVATLGLGASAEIANAAGSGDLVGWAPSYLLAYICIMLAAIVAIFEIFREI